MTLFARAAPDEGRFTRVLDRFYDGVPDTPDHGGCLRGR